MATWLRILTARLTGLFSDSHTDADFKEELRAHEALLTDDLVRRGWTPDQARRQARLSLGNPTSLTQDRRERLVWAPFRGLTADVRFAARQLRAHPGFTLAAALTMALGIGVNTTVFSALNAVALRPLPIAGANRAVRLERWFDSQRRGNIQFLYSYAEYRYLQDGLDTVSDLVAVSAPIQVTRLPIAQFSSRESSDEPPFLAQLVSENFFTNLGVRAEVGRPPTAEEVRTPGGEPVIFLSDAGWRARFNADPAIAGQAITLNGSRFTIVGVAEPAFIGIGNPPEAPDFWAPLGLKVALNSGAEWRTEPAIRALQLIGHLPPSASLAAASARTTAMAPAFTREFPSGDPTIGLTLERATFFGETNDPRFALFVVALAALVGLILLAACANLANMLLARAAGRTREIAVRLSLGAGRARIIRQLLVESVLLSWIGATIALVVSTWSSHLVWMRVAESVQMFAGGRGAFIVDLSPDRRVLLFTSAVATIAGVLFGLAPARQLSRTDIVTQVKASSATLQGPRKSRLRSILVAGQVAVSMTLAVTAGLLARGVVRGFSAEAGFDTRHLYSVGYASDPDPARALATQRALVRQLSGDPVISSVALVDHLPFTGTRTRPVVADAPDGGTRHTLSLLNTVSGSYFDTIGIPVVRGRVFTPDDAAAGTPVAVVSEGAARALWPGRDPIGQRVRYAEQFRPNSSILSFTVIGVVADARTTNISRVDPAFVYTPTKASEEYMVLVRSPYDRRAIVSAARTAAVAVDPPLLRSLTIDNLEDRFVHLQRVLPATINMFALALAALALALAAAGVYGVVSFLASQRDGEVAVRLALGATRRDVVLLVLQQGLAPVAAGMAIGLGCAVALSAMLRALLAAPGSPDLLFGLDAFDPTTFLVVTIVVAAASLVAAAGPAWRTAKVDPIVALKRV